MPFFGTPCISPAHGRPVQHRDLGQRGQCVPLPVNVVSIPNDHHILELMIPNDNDDDSDNDNDGLLEIASSQGHDEVPQADQGTVRLGKEAEDHVVIVDHGSHLLPDDNE